MIAWQTEEMLSHWWLVMFLFVSQTTCFYSVWLLNSINVECVCVCASDFFVFYEFGIIFQHTRPDRFVYIYSNSNVFYDGRFNLLLLIIYSVDLKFNIYISYFWNLPRDIFSYTLPQTKIVKEREERVNGSLKRKRNLTHKSVDFCHCRWPP